MTDDEKTAKQLADAIVKWLDTPQQHLNGETRRSGIEGQLIAHFARIKAQQDRKDRAAHWMFYVGAAGVVLTISLNLEKLAGILWP